MIKSLGLLALVFLTVAPCRAADEKPDLCAPAIKRYTDDPSGPNSKEALSAWQKCANEVFEQAKRDDSERQKDEAATRREWAASLDPKPEGGWKYFMVADDGQFAIFVSQRRAVREGNIVSVWLRYEYRAKQLNASREPYKSDVQREMYDCVRQSSTIISITMYRENNMQDIVSSTTVKPNEAEWSPVIPGTIGDGLIDWACKTTAGAKQPNK